MVSHVERLEKEHIELQDEHTRLGAENRSLKATIESLQASLAAANQQLRFARSTIGRIDAERVEANRLLNDAMHQNKKLAQKLTVKTAFLNDANGTAPANELQGHEIFASIQDLNQKILLISRMCIEAVCSRTEFLNNTAGMNPKLLCKGLAEVIGLPLVTQLQNVNHNEEPIVLQLAIQAALCRQLHEFLSLWPMPASQSLSSDFWRVYEVIRDNEPQDVASRWRALGSKYIREELMMDAQLHDESVASSIKIITKILQVSGVPSVLSDVMNQCRVELGADIDILWKLAGKCAEKVKESVFSTEYEVLLVEPGSIFDRNLGENRGPRLHEAAYRGARVLCTTHLGLQGFTKVASPDDPYKDKLIRNVISKATVVFDHEIAAILAPY